MTSYTVNIPDNKHTFFIEFLELIGAKYEKKEEEFSISDEQKKILDERLNENKANFIPAKEHLSKLQKKYGL